MSLDLGDFVQERNKDKINCFEDGWNEGLCVQIRNTVRCVKAQLLEVGKLKHETVVKTAVLNL